MAVFSWVRLSSDSQRDQAPFRRLFIPAFCCIFLLIRPSDCFASAVSQSLDSAAYSRLSQLNDKADSEGLRALATELDQRAAPGDHQLAILARAIADFRSDRLSSSAERLDSLHQLRSSLEPSVHAMMRRFRAGIRKYMGDRQGGMDEILAGLEAADSMSLPRERAELLVMRAELLLEENQHGDALAVLQSAQRLAERSQHARGLGMVRLNMGNLRYYQKRYEEAWEDYESALRIALDGGYDRLAETALNNLGAVASNLDRVPLALQLFEGLLSTIKPERASWRAMLLGQIAYIRATLGEGEQALRLFSRSITMSDSLGDRRTAADTRQFLAGTLWELGRPDEAIGVMNEALEAMIAEGDVHMQVAARESLWRWYEAVGEKDKALHEARIADQLDDSLKQARYNERLALAEISFETERKEHEIAGQKQALALASAEDKRKRLQRNLSLTAAAGLVIVALFLWRGLRTRTKLADQERELHRKEVDHLLQESENKALHSMLDGQEKERIRVARELHDHVGSMLSTLKVQAGALESRLESKEPGTQQRATNLITLLDKTSSEVRRLSHDMLGSELSRFGLLKAMEDLTASIRIAGKLEVELKQNGMDQRLDSSMEMALYRIAQELVSNALKHAEPQKISIGLERSLGRMRLVVADDGIGFDLGKARAGIGLENVEGRAARIGATVRWESAPGNGTTVSVDCPLADD